MRCPACDDVLLDGRTYCECGWKESKSPGVPGDRTGRWCSQCGSVAWIEQGGLRYCGPCHKGMRKTECAEDAGKEAIEKIMAMLSKSSAVKPMP